MRIRAWLFDFDGVLADTETLHWQGLAHLARREWNLEVDRELYDRVLIGFDDRGALNWLAAQAGAELHEARRTALVAEKQRLITARIATAPLLPGAERIWREARARGPVAIVSGALRDEIVAILTRHRLPPPSVLVAAEDTPIGKPDPAPYLLAVERLADVWVGDGPPPTPAECLVFEDTAAGIAAARRAGCRCVRLATGAPPPEPTAPQPNLTLSGWPAGGLDEIVSRLEPLHEEEPR